MGGHRAGAVAGAALVYALVSDAFVESRVVRAADALSIPPAVPRVLLASVGILACHQVIVLALANWQMSGLRGRWVLRSDSGEYGVATFGLRRGHPIYTADLYRTRDEVEDALAGRPGSSDHIFAQLTSTLMECDRLYFTVVYEIPQADHGFVPRKGMLHARRVAGSGEFRGYWHSTAPGGPGPEDASSGWVTFLRPAAFLSSSRPLSPPSAEPKDPAA
jgi:hypothetical protein